MTDVAGVQNEFRRFGEGINLVHCSLQRRDHIRIGGLIEAHMAVADLDKAQPALLI